MLSSFKIGYMNVQGLTLDKWNVLSQQMNLSPLTPSSSSSSFSSSSSSHFDILFLAETWFVSGYDRYLCHPLALSATPLVNKRQGMRQKGGLLVLVSPYVRSLVSSIAVTEFTLSLTLLLDGMPRTISAVYLPPSLKCVQIWPLLDSLSSSSILLGDINTRYGSMWNDAVSGPADRLIMMQRFQGMSSLLHIRPTSGFARVDHVFVASSCMASFMPRLDIVDLDGVSSDHSCLSLSVSLGPAPILPSRRSFQVTRFYSRYLDFKLTACQLVELYEHLWNSSSLPLYACRAVPSQEVVNYVDAWLLDMVLVTCEEVLGSYDSTAVQAQPDRSLVDDLGPSKRGDRVPDQVAISIFKRARRVDRHDHLLVSRSTSTTVIEDAVDYYSDLYGPSPVASLSPAHLDTASSTLVDLFEEDSIANAIRRYPSAKSPGSDGINGKMVKTLSDSHLFLTHLALLFRLCAKSGRTPTRWNESLIFPIPKNASLERPTISDMRPISMTVMFRRIFESLLLQAVNNHDDFGPLRHFNYGQAGFRRNFSTLSQALVSHDCVPLGYNHKAYLDLKNAYDRVPISRLLDKLLSRSPPGGLVSLVSSLFSSCSSRCVINGQVSDPFLRQRGLFQGSLLSPWLFNIYIDDLADALNPSASDIPTALFFADDIQLQAKFGQDLQGPLDAVFEWTVANGMEINIDKSAYVPPASSFLPTPSLRCGLSLPVRSSYVYLGIPHTASGMDLASHLSKRIECAKSTLNFCRFSGRFDHLSQLCRLNIYKIFIRSSLEYGAPLVAQWLKNLDRIRPRRRGSTSAARLWKSLESVQDDALRWIFQVKRFTRELRSLSGLGTVQDRFEELAARFTLHLDRLSPDHPLLLVQSMAVTSSLSIRCRSHPLQPLISSSHLLTKRALAMHRLTKLAESSLLSSRVAWTCRHPTSFYDSLLLLPDPAHRRLALSWRTNTFGRFSRCSTCGSPYSPSHIRGCSLLPISAKDLTSLLNSKSYTSFISHMTFLKSSLSHSS